MPKEKTTSPQHKEAHKGILLGIVVAIIAGVMLGGWMPELAVRFELLGELFLRSLMMIVVPLVMLSLLAGITGLGDIRKLGPIGRRTIIFYMSTTALSVLVGLVLVNIVKPGKGITPGEKHPGLTYKLDAKNKRKLLVEKRWKRLRFEEYKGKYSIHLLDQKLWGPIAKVSEKSITVKYWQKLKAEGVVYLKTTDGKQLPFRQVDGKWVSAIPNLSLTGKGLSIVLPIADKVKGKEKRTVIDTLKDVFVGMIPRNVFDAMANTNVLALIFFSLLLGGVLTVLGPQGQLAIDVIRVFNDAIMKLVQWIMYTAPLGIFGLIAARIGHAGGFEGFLPELMGLGKYAFVVVLGLAIHAFVTLPIILWVFGRRNPISYAGGMAAALLNAFSTASSSATLPLTMEGVENENGISNRTASFVLPLGATINMDGTALYEAAAAMFIAQVYGIELSMMQQVIIFLTATLAAVGAAGIPEAGLVTLVIVLKAVGLPIEGIALILTIDWLLDRFRTTVNVWGDSVGAGVIERYEYPNGYTPEPLPTLPAPVVAAPVVEKTSVTPASAEKVERQAKTSTNPPKKKKKKKRGKKR
ncbi:MAG TPA: sodium:dicarboxylate symporter [Myxococcales bacterium]|nr:sodium:dicarboxylate symporter [Deltaproteobacteria bacterium]HAA59185.1 sodium:dicarboxylate symporter [Myxococcales bacterium]|tara:strand:- start:4696 stop:6441 length:1746 start_codon:yes stop_codon:yes gene_type:complete